MNASSGYGGLADTFHTEKRLLAVPGSYRWQSNIMVGVLKSLIYLYSSVWFIILTIHTLQYIDIMFSVTLCKLIVTAI